MTAFSVRPIFAQDCVVEDAAGGYWDVARELAEW